MKNKKIIWLIIGVVIAIVIVVAIVLMVNQDKGLTCTKTVDVPGFEIREKLYFTFEDDKVNYIDLAKNVEVKSEKVNFESFKTAFSNQLESLYAYNSEKNYEITTDGKTITFKMSGSKYGVILNNLTINSEEKDNSIDYSSTGENNIDSNDNSINIGDEYTKGSLKKKIVNEGYTCK